MADEYGSDFITITDGDGNEFEVEVLSTVEYNGASYMAVIPADGEDDLRLEVSILKSVEENGEEYLAEIEDEMEFEQVSDILMAMVEKKYDVEYFEPEQ
mgnify:CR=1 FL=1